VPVPHDAAAPLAFVVTCDGRSLGHATDFGHVGRGLVSAFRHCDAVLVESNYDPDMLRDGPYPWSLKQRILGGYGHLSNDDTARYLGRDLGEACRIVVLAHLSRQNNHPEVALMAAESALRRRGRTEVRVEVTGPEGTDWLEVGAAPPPAAPKAPKQLRLF
jgi:phosphoribosyl 1,2-cyclic phosphodiesterase